MPDPMPARNRKLPPDKHRVDAISFRLGTVECACGEAMVLTELPENAVLRQAAVADLFSVHRRLVRQAQVSE